MKLAIDVRLICNDIGLEPCSRCRQDHICIIQGYKHYFNIILEAKNPHNEMRKAILNDLSFIRINDDRYMAATIKYYFPQYLMMYKKMAVLK